MKKIITFIGIFGIFASFAPTTFAGYFNDTPIVRCDVQITRTLQVGSENSEVYALQQLLSRAGYLYATPNGYFGPATKSAVKRFQSANYIQSTGIVGPSTRNALNERFCDEDVRGDSLSWYGDSYYGYASGSTYVAKEDPYVQVILPTPATPMVYPNPPSSTNAVSYGVNTAASMSSGYTFSPSVNTSFPVPVQSQSVNSQIASVNIIYTPSVGYIYSIVPKSGSLTITSPVKNTSYKEGDTVSLSWYTSNLPTNQYQIILENRNTGQSRAVAFTTSNQASFVLTKEVLDTLCSGACDANQQASFRIIIATPTTDIAGVTSVLRATIDPITVKRAFSVGQVTVTASKTPVSSDEVFKLFVNVPSNINTATGEQFSFRLRAICVNNVQVSIAGVPCGQDFSFPVGNRGVQQEVPVKATNTTFYKQDVNFEVVVVNGLGQVVSVGQTKVVVNAAPFNW